MLIAANLNQQTLRGGVPTAFAGLLTKQQRDEFLAYAVEPPGRPADWMRVIDHQYGSIDFARWDDPGGPLEPSDPVCGRTSGA